MNGENTCIVVGASGFIGSYLLDALCGRGCKVIALTRNVRLAKNDSQHVEWVVGNIEDQNIWNKILVNNGILIYLAHSENMQNDNFIKSLSSLADNARAIGLKKIIYCSTASVFGKVNDENITELTRCDPLTIYEKNKLLTEKVLIQKINNQVELIILRPTAVFGCNGKNLNYLLDRVIKKRKLLNYIIRSLYGNRKLNLIYVENLVAVIVHFINSKEKYYSEIYIVSEDDEIINNYVEIEKILLDTIFGSNTKQTKISIPKYVLKIILYCRGRSNVNPYRVYNNKKLLNLGIKKPYSLKDAIIKYATVYVAKK